MQDISEKIVINGERDWEKVIITTNPDDVKGFIRKGEVRSSASNSWNFKGKAGVDKKASMKIQREAASLKCHVVLLTDQTKQNQTFFTAASSDKYGTAYGYE